MMKTLIKSAIAATIGSAAAGAAPGGSLLRSGLGVLASRIALRSLPGAALVGGLMLARHALKRRQAKQVEPRLLAAPEPEFGDTPDCAETVQRST